MLSTRVRLYSAFRIVIYHTTHHHADKLIFLTESIIFFLDKWLKSLSRSVWHSLQWRCDCEGTCFLYQNVTSHQSMVTVPTSYSMHQSSHFSIILSFSLGVISRPCGQTKVTNWAISRQQGPKGYFPSKGTKNNIFHHFLLMQDLCDYKGLFNGLFSRTNWVSWHQRG